MIGNKTKLDGKKITTTIIFYFFTVEEFVRLKQVKVNLAENPIDFIFI